MAIDLEGAQVYSISEAVERGLPSVVRSASTGIDVIFEKHGQPQAVLLGMERFSMLEELEQDLQSAILVLGRIATDDGSRTSLDEAIRRYGFDPEELRAEVESELRSSEQ